MDYETRFLAEHPDTADLLCRGNLVAHPAVTRIVLHGSRGPARRRRPDSDLDLSLVVEPAAPPESAAALYGSVIETTLAAWRGEVELDLAVVFDDRGCGLVCFETVVWDPAVCTRGGRSCFGLFKTQKGFRGFVDTTEVEVRRMYPCLAIWRRQAPGPSWGA